MAYTIHDHAHQGGFGKEIKGNMQGTNILNRLEDDYRGQMTDGKMFEDDRIETNIVGEPSVMKLLKRKNIHPVGGTGVDGITKTHDFLKDVDAHVIMITNKEYIENIHVTHGHIQIKQFTEMLIQEGKWQPSFQNIIENMIGNCTTRLPKRSRSAKPHGTLPKAMDFNDIISVDLKELQPEYRKNGYRYILYIVDEFSKLMKGILLKDKEAETVVMAVYTHWVFTKITKITWAATLRMAH